jgi:hypothetical protein
MFIYNILLKEIEKFPPPLYMYFCMLKSHIPWYMVQYLLYYFNLLLTNKCFQTPVILEYVTIIK